MATTTTNATTVSNMTTLDAMARTLGAQLPPELGWQLAGWAAHLRDARHQRHLANSWAKHRREFGRIEREAHALVVAACFDFGLDVESAVALIRERVAARDARDGEERAAEATAH